MICLSKMFVDPRLKWSVANLPIPYYSQALSYWLTRTALLNNHLFSSDYSQCERVIVNITNARDHVLNGKDVVAICTSVEDFNNNQHADQDNVRLLDFTHRCNPQRAKHICAYPSYSLNDIMHLLPEGKAKPMTFNTAAFVRDTSDAMLMFNVWKKYLRGNLYILKHTGSDVDFAFAEMLEKENANQDGRMAFMFSFDKDIELVVNTLLNSTVAVFFIRELVYQFWAIVLRCFPLIFQDDILNSRFFYIDNELAVQSALVSLYTYTADLQQMLSQFSSFEFGEPDINIFLEA